MFGSVTGIHSNRFAFWCVLKEVQIDELLEIDCDHVKRMNKDDGLYFHQDQLESELLFIYQPCKED